MTSLFTLWATLLTAQAERPLTYDEALRAAVENNPALATARFAREQSAGAVLLAQGGFDPNYTADAQWSRRTTKGFFQGFPFESRSEFWNVGQSLQGTTGTGTTYALNTSIDRNYSEFITDFGLGQSNTQIQDAYTSDVNVSVTQQLLQGVRFRYNVQNITRARQQLTTAELAEARALQDALYTVAEAYWSWVYAKELERIADESVEVATEALRVGRLQLNSGQLAPVEVTRLEAAHVQAEQTAIDAHNTAEQAANVLLLAMGVSPGDAIAPATPPGDVPDDFIDAEAAAEVAVSQNLDLAVSRANLDLSRIEYQNAKHGLLPQLAATGAAGVAAQDTSAGASVSGLLDDDNQPFVSVGGRFSVPLGNRAARGERDRSAAVVAQREREMADLERSVRAQVEEQVRTLRSARRRMELADANARLAEQTLGAEEALASAGRNIQRDVLQARTDLARAKADAAKARTDYQLARAQLLRLQGQLDSAAP